MSASFDQPSIIAQNSQARWRTYDQNGNAIHLGQKWPDIWGLSAKK